MKRGDDGYAAPTILVIDDEEMNRSLLRRFLMMEGYEVRLAAGVPQGMEALDANRIDLVLLDLLMPEENGIDGLRHIRTHPQHKEIGVIVATSATDSEWAVRCLELGADDFVTKPLDLDVLRSRIHATLRRTARTRSTPAAPGGEALFDGRYDLIEEVGEGSFGIVHRAFDEVTRQTVAVKRFPVRMSGSRKAMLSFERECRCVCRLQHANVPQILNFGMCPEGTAYLVTEFVNGPSLADLLFETGPQSVARSAQVLAPIADALAEAHGHDFVHRDVKPGHILLEIGEGREIPKLIDFGIAALASTRDAWSADDDGTVCGTPPYMAPEQLTGTTAGPGADIYSLGAVLLEMLTGTPPFVFAADDDPAETARRQISFCPPRLTGLGPATSALMSLVHVAMHIDPARRPSADEFRERLEDAASIDDGALPRHVTTEVVQAERETTRLPRDPSQRRPKATSES